jgi:hypothetical protein
MEADPKRALPASAATLSVSLPCFDDNDQIVAPPDEVLTVQVVGSLAFLRVESYEETNSVTTTTRKSQAMVDARALLLALANQMGVHHLLFSGPAEGA